MHAPLKDELRVLKEKVRMKSIRVTSNPLLWKKYFMMKNRCVECCASPSEAGPNTLNVGCIVALPISSKLRAHLASKFESHVRLPSHLDRARHNSQWDKENEEILMRLGRIRLKMIWCSQPDSNFEHEVSCQIRNLPERNRLNHLLGEQHHGRKFCVIADDIMIELCREKLVEILSTVDPATESPLFFAGCSDKYTLNHMNIQGHLLKFMVKGVMEIAPLSMSHVDYSEGKSAKANDLARILVANLQ